MNQSLPLRANLEHLKKQAKDLLTSAEAGNQEALQRLASGPPELTLAHAQLAIAREYGFDSWPKLKAHVEALATPDDGLVKQFVQAAFGNVLEAKALWQNNPALRASLVAAICAGDADPVESLLPGNDLAAFYPPLDRPLLNYACFSRLGNDPAFEPGALRTVQLLLDRGADPNLAYPAQWGGETFRETPLYGAAGVLNNASLTKQLLDSGADPDDQSVVDGVYRGESVYHASEFPGQNECLRLLFEAGASQEAKDYCIKRKLDYDDLEGVRLYLEHGAKANRPFPDTALNHAILRERSLETLELLFQYGADANQPDQDGTKPYSLAMRLGRKDYAEFLLQKGAVPDLALHDRILVAATDGDDAEVDRILAQHPNAVRDFQETMGKNPWADGAYQTSPINALHDLARIGNLQAIKGLVRIGLDPAQKNQWSETPLHWACVTGHHEVAGYLLSLGVPTDGKEQNHQATAMGWLYWGSQFWTERRGDYAETLRVMLRAGVPPPGPGDGTPEVQHALVAWQAGN